jgi:hypothetical protein
MTQIGSIVTRWLVAIAYMMRWRLDMCRDEGNKWDNDRREEQDKKEEVSHGWLRVRVLCL